MIIALGVIKEMTTLDTIIISGKIPRMRSGKKMIKMIFDFL